MTVAIREDGGRILDPLSIEARLSGVSGEQADLLLKLYRTSQAQLSDNEKRLRRQLVRDFQAAARQIQADMAETFANLGGETWDLASARRVGRDQVLFNQIRDRIRALGATVTDTVADGLANHFNQAYADGAYRLDVVTPESVNLNFAMLPDTEVAAMLAEPWSGANFSERLGLITDEMANTIKHQLTRSMIAGESWAQAARRIRDEMGTAGRRSVWRAEMVARTELAHAAEVATALFNQANADVIDKEIWVATPGACAAICRPKNGKDVEQVGRPPDDSHPNCTCDVLAVPKHWEDLGGGAGGPRKPRSRDAWVDVNLGGTD